MLLSAVLDSSSPAILSCIEIEALKTSERKVETAVLAEGGGVPGVGEADGGELKVEAVAKEGEALDLLEGR